MDVGACEFAGNPNAFAGLASYFRNVPVSLLSISGRHEFEILPGFESAALACDVPLLRNESHCR